MRTAESALMWDLLTSGQYANLVERPDVRRESAVHAKCIAIDYLHFS